MANNKLSPAAETGTAAEETTSESAASISVPAMQNGIKKWMQKNRLYIIGFFIPVILTYIAYAIFGLYPFGEKSVLALDLNAQYVYFFEAFRDMFWGDGSMFYSWARNLSGEFMGIIGYYLASPFTLIVMLLPEKMMLTSLLLMILAKIGAASVTFSYYMNKSKHLAPFQSMTFGLLYSMSAYMIIQTIDPMWLDGLVFLPLIILGVEYLIDDGRKLNFIIPLAIMFVANFYIGYMIGIFSAIYFLYYLFAGSEKCRGKLFDYLYTCSTFAVSAVVAVMLAAFMVLPVYNALQLGKFTFTDPDYSFKTQFNPFTIAAQLLTCQYDSVNVQGSPEIYCGILTVVLLPLFFLNSRITLRQKFGHGFLLAVMFFSMYIKPVDMMWHGGQVPNWLPFRYSFIVTFILLSMAASALREIGSVKPSHFGGVFFGLLALILYLNNMEYASLDIMKSIWLSIGLSAVYLLILAAINAGYGRVVLPFVMTFVIAGELVFNAVNTMKSVHKEVVYSTRASYETFVQSGRAATRLMEKYDKEHGNHRLYRSEKTFTRCINDNLAFGLNGLTHSSSVMDAKTLNFIETLGYNKRSYLSRYDGTTQLADSVLGIRYVLDDGSTPARSLLHSDYVPVASYDYVDKDNPDSNGNPVSKTITVYENPNALSIGYMVSDQLLKLDHLGNDNPFRSQNIMLSSMIGNTVFTPSVNEEGKEVTLITSFSEYYTPIDIGEPVLGAVTIQNPYNNQTVYRKMETGDPTIDYRFTVTSPETVYAFIKTENQQQVNLWLGTRQSEEQDYEFRGFGTYFETRNYCILDLGQFDLGTQVSLRMTINNDQNETIVKEPFFYYFNSEAYQNDIVKLQDGQLEIERFTGNTLRGTVTAGEGEVLFTSIPYQPGWTVKVDGKKVETKQCLNAMIYVPLTPGTHKVSFSYTPPGFTAGVCMGLAGIVLLVLFYRYDKKNNKVLLAKAKAKKAGQNAA